MPTSVTYICVLFSVYGFFRPASLLHSERRSDDFWMFSQVNSVTASYIIIIPQGCRGSCKAGSSVALDLTLIDKHSRRGSSP